VLGDASLCPARDGAPWRCPAVAECDAATPPHSPRSRADARRRRRRREVRCRRHPRAPTGVALTAVAMLMCSTSLAFDDARNALPTDPKRHELP
jgi:hypothetical protein